MDRLINEQAVIDSIEFFQMNPQHFDFVNLIDDIKEIPSAEPYKGMTNGEVLETIFPNAECDFKKFCKEDTVVFDLNGFYMRVSADWWNSPYEPQESEE